MGLWNAFLYREQAFLAIAELRAKARLRLALENEILLSTGK